MCVVIRLDGVVTAGHGQGAFFMGLPWVTEGVRGVLGFVPYPGTLNVRVDSDTVSIWRQIRDGQALVLAPPPPETCGARLFPAIVDPDVEAAVIVPDVTRYGDDLLELIAAVHLRSRLGLRDHDRVTLRLRATPA